jgi:integrase
MTLTDIAISNLPAPDKGQKLYPDGLVASLYVRVSQGGSKTFVLVQGKQRRFTTLGRYGEITLAKAREAARRLRAEKTLGHILPVSLDTARSEYLAQLDVRPNTRLYYERNLNRLKAGKLSELTGRDINRILDQLSPSSRLQALRSFTAFFSWCIRRHYLDRSPCERLQAEQSPSRSRVLSNSELKSIWESTAEPTTFNTIVRLLLLTGQRRSEIASLQFSWIKDDTITLPASVTKNGREHTFPTSSLAATLLKECTTQCGSTSLLFHARGSVTAGCATPFNGWSKSKAALDKASGIVGWTLHDLRRTFATIHARIGTPIHVTERLLNHVSGTQAGIVGVYQRHTFFPEMADAMRNYEEALKRILDIEPLRLAA